MKNHYDENTNNFVIKERLVKSNRSKILSNWQQLCSWNGYDLSMEEFLENLKWVCEDPMDEYGGLTREIGLTKNGIVKIKRVRDKGLCLMYRLDNNMNWWGDCFRTPCDKNAFAPDGWWSSNYKISISARDRI